MYITKTKRFKVKSDSYNFLNKATIEVNQVWNWANTLSFEASDRNKRINPKFLSHFDLDKLSSGSSKYFECINSHVIKSVNKEFVFKRNQAKKRKLKFRKSHGSKKSLGWIPFWPMDFVIRQKFIKIFGKHIRIFEFNKLKDIELRESCFAQDACGTWWLCLSYRDEITDIPAPNENVGIDLGLKSVATTSDGHKLEGNWYRKEQQKLANLQRRGHRKQAKFLHRKIKNRRKHDQHVFSRQIINKYQNIYIGDVSSYKLAKTKMAKSVYDSTWCQLKQFFIYKGQQAGRSVKIIDERNTTRVCSCCGQFTGPSGLRQLVVRNWQCISCGQMHDRDVNSALNICRFGLKLQPPLAEMTLIRNLGDDN